MAKTEEVDLLNQPIFKAADLALQQVNTLINMLPNPGGQVPKEDFPQPNFQAMMKSLKVE